MLIEPLLGYKSTWRILELMLETPRKSLSRTELFQHTLLGNAPLSQALQRLTVAHVLIKEKRGKKESYHLNLGNEYLLAVQKMWELERSSLHYLDYDLKVILSELVRQLSGITSIVDIILFGSHAKGTASVRSDIDVALIFEDKIGPELVITKIVTATRQKYKREIQVHYFTTKTFTEKDALAQEIKKEGISLLK